MGAKTKLLRPITRELASTDRKGQTIIMTIEPGDIVTFRIKGKRSQRCSIYLGHVFNLAAIMSLEYEYKKRLEQYNIKKKAGVKGLRAPKKPFNPFSKLYINALK